LLQLQALLLVLLIFQRPSTNINLCFKKVSFQQRDLRFLMIYFLKLAVVGMVTVPAALVTILLGLFDPHGKHVYCIGRSWAWLILTLGGVAIRVHGLDRLDARQPYLFMVNHQSNVDILVLLQSLAGFQLRWIAKKELLWVPFFGWAMWAGKHIAVDRSDSAGALGTLKKAAMRMANGISVVVFPEGTRSLDGRLLPFKRGGFLLAAKTGTAIVPVTINGSQKILPKGAWRLRPGIVEVHVSEPISMRDRRPGALRALADEVQRIIEKKLAPHDAVPGELNDTSLYKTPGFKVQTSRSRS
jgi:1-acyl-sn-glycerol-3-phosphate acyltransferase